MLFDCYLLNDTLFAKQFIRIVHGERGDYVEFSKDMIIPTLHNKFKYKTNSTLLEEGHYYVYLYPDTDLNTKVYFQLKTVKYADYKIGLYYVSVSLFKDFKDPEKLF